MEDRTDLRPADEGDAKITDMLRDLYAPPAEGAYWDALEGRIMAYIAEHRPAVVRIPVNWWSDLAGWAAPGLAAAALLFVAARDCCGRARTRKSCVPAMKQSLSRSPQMFCRARCR